MARDHARIHLDIWTDDDFLALTQHAQWLYFHLLSSASLSYAGVADWRPGRIAAKAAGLTVEDVETMAAELIATEFILVDASTEEVAIRSFVKWDGLMKSPNVAAALVKAHGAIASPALRGLVVGQLQRLRDTRPALRGWSRTEVIGLLEKRSKTFDEALAAVWETLPETLRETLPSTLPETVRSEIRNPSGNPSVNTPLTPTPSPTPSSRVVQTYVTTGAEAS